MAVQAKGQLGVIMGIEDDMPAYRVWDLQARKIRHIPFTQIITHEGHYPYRSYDLWDEDAKEL